MKDESKTKKQLINELYSLRQQVAELKETEADKNKLIQDLRLSEERMKYLISLSPVTIFTCKPSGDYGATYVSSNVTDQTGYEPHEFTDDSCFWADHIHPEDRERVFDDLKSLLERDYHIHVYRFLHKDGSYRWMYDDSRLIRDEKGNPVEVIGFWIDITEMKYVGKNIAESERKYREFANLLPQIVFEANIQGALTFVNRSALAISGYTQEDIEKGVNIMDTIIPEDRARAQENLQRLLAGESSLGHEYTFLRKDGSTFPVIIHTSAVIRDGHVAGLRGFAVDITDLRRAEEALQKTAQTLQAIIDASPLAIFTLDNDLRVTNWSPSAEHIFGWTKDEAIGQYNPIVPEEKWDEFKVLVSKVLSGVAYSGSEVKRRTKDGRAVDVNVSTAPLRDDHGNVVGAVGVIQDITERKKAEEELRQSEEKYRTIIENIQEGYHEVDIRGNFTFFNDSMCKILGYDREELLGMNNRQYADEEANRKVYQVYNRVYRTGEPVKNFEWQIIRKDGNRRDVAVSVSLIRDVENNPTGFRGIVRDITDRKLAEEALRVSEARYRALIESQIDLISRYLPDTILTFVNDAYCQFFGKTREELIGHSFLFMIAPEFHELVMRETENLVKDPRPLSGEYLNYRWDGKECWIQWVVQCIFDENSRVVEMQAVGRDITDRKHTEEELKESRRRLADIIDFLPDATIVIDKDSTVIAWNRAIETMTGVKEEEMLGKGNYEYALPFYGKRRPILIDLVRYPDPETEKQYTTIYRKGDSIFGEAYTPNLSPGNIHLSATASVLRNSSGEIVGAIMCTRNNTERKRLESQLQQAQKMEAIGTLAGGIAHDFNNLLMAIQGNASLMLIHTDTGDPRYEKMKAIEDQVVAGADLTKQLLGFARIGRYELKPTDLNEIAEKSSTMFGRTKKEIVIHKKYEHALWAVEADASQLEQVLMNIYVNAWQAMPGGGHIYLETANLIVTEGDERSSYLMPGRCVKISVTDTGVGMDEKTKERIFEPFFTTKEMGRGTGLGLAMVYGIVKGHKGAINVYSEKGIGTTFNIYLPASEKEAMKDEKPEGVILKGQETILLVDDEEIIMNVMKEILEALGYKILVANNGRDALTIYELNKDKIDLVILDMIMPEMGGGETFDHLKKINPDIKVILSSGYSLNGEAVGIINRGCKGFIQKPVTMANLSQKIREVLGKV